MVTSKTNYYDEIAEGYDELHREEQLHKLEFLSNFIKPNPYEKLLDVGCGTGISTEYWDCKRYGIDPSTKLIEIAKHKNKNTEYKIAPAENIPYPDNYFDCVTSITAIQNFSNIEKALEEIKRVLKKNKKIMISTLKESKKKQYINKKISEIFAIKEVQEHKIDIFFVCENK